MRTARRSPIVSGRDALFPATFSKSIGRIVCRFDDRRAGDEPRRRRTLQSELRIRKRPESLIDIFSGNGQEKRLRSILGYVAGHRSRSPHLSGTKKDATMVLVRLHGISRRNEFFLV